MWLTLIRTEQKALRTSTHDAEAVLSVICCCVGWSSIPWSFTVTCYELLKHEQHHQALSIQTTEVEPVIFTRTTPSTHWVFVSTALPNILFSTLPRELLYCNSLTRYRFFLEVQALLSKKWANLSQILLRNKNRYGMLQPKLFESCILNKSPFICVQQLPLLPSFWRLQRLQLLHMKDFPAAAGLRDERLLPFL